MEDEFQKAKALNFEAVVEEFTKYFAQFENGLNHTEFANADTKAVCYALYGIAGAGKSALIARLLSALEPAVFLDTLNKDNKKKDFCVIEEVTIGHKFTATTVVPKIYKIGHLYIVDMPGFMEGDIQKKISIEILQKCFLTRVKNVRLLIVIDGAKMTDPKLEGLRKMYHEPLYEMLGDHYKSSIDHFHMIITKNDIYGLTDDEMERTTLKASAQINKEDHLASLFVTRVGERHIRINLENDTREALLEKIEKMLKFGEGNERTPPASSWNIERLEATGDIMSRLCSEKMHQVGGQLDTLARTVEDKARQQNEMLSTMAKETQGVCNRLRKAIEHCRIVLKEFHAKSKVVNGFESREEALLSNLKHMDDVLEVDRKQNELFDQNCVMTTFIEKSCFNSVKGAWNASGSYNVTVSLHLPEVLGDGPFKGDYLVLAIEDDGAGADYVLKELIKNGNALVPKRLQDIWDNRHQKIYFNSKTRSGKDFNSKNTQDTTEGPTLSLKLTRPKPFKVYVFTEHNYKKIDLFENLRAKFGEQMAKDLAKKSMIEEELNTLRSQHDKNTQELLVLKNQVKEAKNTITAVQEAIKNLQTDHRKATSNFVSLVTHLSNDMNELKENKVVSNLSKVETIFRDYAISTDLSEPLRHFKARFTTLEVTLVNIIDESNRYLAEDENDLQKLLTRHIDVFESTNGTPDTQSVVTEAT